MLTDNRPCLIIFTKQRDQVLLLLLLLLVVVVVVVVVVRVVVVVMVVVVVVVVVASAAAAPVRIQNNTISHLHNQTFFSCGAAAERGPAPPNS